MSLSVALRGQHVATFRYIQVGLMETLAAWVPTTPEMEAKLLFGEHIWDCAQHADALGKRTHELRLPLQHSLAPTGAYLNLLTLLRQLRPTTERISGFYEVMLPALAARYRRYLHDTDGLMDAPTVRIVERVLWDHERMLQRYREVVEELPGLRHSDDAWRDRLTQEEARIPSLLADAPAAPALAPQG